MASTTTLPTVAADPCPTFDKISIDAYDTPEGERPKHFNHFQTFRESANKALQRAYPKKRKPRYTAVHAILMYWAEDNLGVVVEVELLRKLLKDTYHYQTETFVIPNSKAQRAPLNRLEDFKDDHADPDHLLIVYYAGHAENAKHNHCIWRSGQSGCSEKVDWNLIQPWLLSEDFDCLMLLDCCYAGKGGRDAGSALHGTNQIIAACGPESSTTGVAYNSFTKVLVRQLELAEHEYRTNGKKYTTVRLHSELFQHGRELKYAPFYLSLTDKDYFSIELSPMVQLVDLDESDEDKSAVDSTLLDSSSSSSGELRPRVLVAIHLSESPRGDLTAFLQGEGIIPEYVTGIQVVDVHAVFTSNSTLVLVTMPLEIWSLLPNEVPCSFVANVYSGDLLHGIKAKDDSVTQSDLQQAAGTSFPISVLADGQRRAVKLRGIVDKTLRRSIISSQNASKIGGTTHSRDEWLYELIDSYDNKPYRHRSIRLWCDMKGTKRLFQETFFIVEYCRFDIMLRNDIGIEERDLASGRDELIR